MLTGAILIGMLTGAIFYAESHMKANNYLCEAVLKGRTFPFVRHTGHSVTPLILFTIASPQALQTNASGCILFHFSPTTCRRNGENTYVRTQFISSSDESITNDNAV